MWRPQDLELLRSAADVFDHEAAAKSVQKFLDDVRNEARSVSDSDQKDILKQLRRARFFDLMRRVGEALSSAGVATHHARRQHGQALIEQGLLVEALAILETLAADPSCPSEERAEAGGLIGRVHKQNYVDHFAMLGPARGPTLEASIQAYHGVYASDRPRYTWQGINAVAMTLRGRRDGILVGLAIEPKILAEEVLGHVASAQDHWDLATAAESCVAMDRWDDAVGYLTRYVQHPNLDAFSCASTLRQLKQVWQLTEDGPGGGLLTVLQAAIMLGSPDSSKSAPERIGGRLCFGERELKSARAHALARGPILQKAFGRSGTPFDAYKLGYDRALAVGRIESAGKGVGTGFLVRALDLFKMFARNAEEFLLVTNAHVIGQTFANALRPSDAMVRLDALDNRRCFGVGEILFESPMDELDVTIARLDSAVTGVEPYPIAPLVEPALDGRRPRRFYVIGYPLAGKLTLSMEDSFQVGWRKPKLHYRTPTEQGNSGSPVFDDSWRLVAVHHAGSDTMQRLDGQSGTYPSNEGIWIHAVAEAIALL